ncbi:hypothetical protein IGI04_030520 [Brassica rapa subsp. trilocularis]|uniref:Uncharacterized protein n=1 Tax=Brassica rapa subsp. trilocularis TaxID=1813537 RepID=A0ABQ7LUA3_BRACM|nr:hypothetical protein IGI04_030520 [Brassica rapa subsp. trilocularis]
MRRDHRVEKPEASAQNDFSVKTNDSHLIAARKHSEDDGISSMDRLPHSYEREEGERTSQTMRRIPCREATKDPNFCNTKTTAHCLGEYYAPGQGSAADGSSQANDIDGKKKIKWARNSLQEYNRKSNDDPKVSIQSYGNEIDVWSEGIILIILLCGVPLFWAANILLIVSSI